MRVNEIGVEMEERGTFYRSPPLLEEQAKKQRAKQQKLKEEIEGLGMF